MSVWIFRVNTFDFLGRCLNSVVQSEWQTVQTLIKLLFDLGLHSQFVKTQLSKYLNMLYSKFTIRCLFFPTKKYGYFFLFLHENICWGYSLEACFQYPQHAVTILANAHALINTHQPNLGLKIGDFFNIFLGNTSLKQMPTSQFRKNTTSCN